MEIAFEAVGSNGKFQKIIAITIILITPMCLLIGIAFPLLTKEPGFFCKEKSSNSKEFEICLKENFCKNNFLYEINPKETLFNWSYSFNLYCNKAYLTRVYGTTFFIGGMFGAIFLSPYPDKYGRKEIYKNLSLMIFILHAITLFSFNEWQLLITVFLLGTTSFAYSMSSSIITEYMDRNYAGLIMTLNNVNFPVTGIFAALFFTYVNNWRIMFLFTSSLSLMNYYLISKYLIESPRWLNSKNKFMETLDAFKKIAEINGTQEEFARFKSLNSSKK